MWLIDWQGYVNKESLQPKEVPRLNKSGFLQATLAQREI
jgi:hypothetical protein